MHPLLTRVNKDMCISSKLHPIYSAFSLNQFMDAPHWQNGQKMFTRVLPRDITLNKSKVLWYFRRLVFVCNLLYLSNCKVIFTTVTSAKPLREGVTLLPSPFGCVMDFEGNRFEVNMYSACISTSWRVKESSWGKKFLLTFASMSSSLACFAHSFTTSRSSVTGSHVSET